MLDLKLTLKEIPYPFNYYLSITDVLVLEKRLAALEEAQIAKVVSSLDSLIHYNDQKEIVYFGVEQWDELVNHYVRKVKK